MNSYIAAQDVKSVINLVDSDGSAIVATAANYRVLNEQGGVVQGPSAIAPWTGTETQASIVVTANNNQLIGTSTRGLRRVELTLTTATGTKILEDAFIIEASDPLVIAMNSFITYSQALLTASANPKWSKFNAASRSDKISALLAARDGLTRVTYKWEGLIDPRDFAEPEFVVFDLSLVSVSDYNTLPEEFKAALAKAQIAEANHLLGGDEIARFRESGLMSMTVGETSQMFRPGKPLQFPICEEAMRILGRYIQHGKRLART
jgi:hypothetical protein